jgi:hypothetical protein
LDFDQIERLAPSCGETKVTHYPVRPLVEVIAPDGSKSFWVAAVGQNVAVDAVRKFVPSDHIAKFSGQRLPIDPVLGEIRRGEVRKVEP